MKVTENTTAGHVLLDEVRRGREERVGIHVSDLIHCLRKAWANRMYDGEDGATESDEDTLVFLLGQGHHTVLEGSHRPETDVDKDGIRGRIDRVEQADPDGMRVCEIKTTRASANKDVLGSAHYFEQLAAYAVMAGVSRGRLYVIHMVGNWRPPTPILRAYDVDWDPKELEAWWEELVHRAQGLAMCLQAATQPMEDFRYTWECERCPWREKLGCDAKVHGIYDGGFFGTTTPAWERVGRQDK